MRACTVELQAALWWHMSVEASESMSEIWTKLEGHAVNGVFPLRRYVGGSDHSGVFLTEFTKRGPSEVALKLVSAIPHLAESQLSHWLTAADLAHPHLIRTLEAGRCRLNGVHYLYAVMEYADQNLAQLLEHRALTEDEAREMLVPTLNALAFLHQRKFVQGQLKPSNILVVGDQLKLASDTIRPVREATDGIHVMSVYDPPEARDGSCSTAGDIWALGVSLSEALTRTQPLGLHDGGGGVVLPPDLSPTFREIVARCLSRRPYDRPKVAELEAWVRGQHTGPAQVLAVSETAATKAAGPEAAMSESAIKSAQRPVIRAVVSGTVVILALSWTGMRVFRTNQAPTPSAAEASRDTGFQTPAPLQTPSEPAPVVPEGRPPLPVSPSEVHEEIPDVPRRARQTIHGHIRVSVRVIVEKEGTVFAALVDEPGPSRYFGRLAIEAAKKWTFPPVDTQASRLMLLRFDFTRKGTTARAVTLR